MSETKNQGRSAVAFEPLASPAAINVTRYRFGADEAATRADRVTRIPSAAIIVHRSGRLMDCNDSRKPTLLPRVALMGPSDYSHIWATQPNTEFFMVNLAPGATNKLFDIQPGDIRNQLESLDGHELGQRLESKAAGGSEILHQYLCDLVLAHRGKEQGRPGRILAVIDSLRHRRLGCRVRDYADHFGMTCRTLQRLAHAQVGLSPKHLIAIERLRELIRLTAGGWNASGADLAQVGGFFDQSHLRYEMARYEMGTLSEMIDGDHIVVRK